MSRSSWEDGGKKQSQMEMLNSAALSQPSMTVSGCETAQSSEQTQRSTERRRDGDRGTARGRDKEKETHSASSSLGVAPSGGTKRDVETRPNDQDRMRESENQKERKRLKQGGREDERRRDETSVPKRNQPSSSSALHSTERRERLYSGSFTSWKPFRDRYVYPSDQFCLKTNRDLCLDLMHQKNSYHLHQHHQPSSNYREIPRAEHSPPSLYYGEDQDLLLFEPAENFHDGFSGVGSMQNRSRNESKAQRGEQRSEKTLRGWRETPEFGDGGGGGRQKEEKARKIEARRRSSSDSVRSSSSHKNDREDRRDGGREKQKANKLQEVTS